MAYSVVLVLAPLALGESIGHISSKLCHQLHYVGNLKLAMMEVFIPQKLAKQMVQINAFISFFFFSESQLRNIYQPTTGFT